MRYMIIRGENIKVPKAYDTKSAAIQALKDRALRGKRRDEIVAYELISVDYTKLNVIYKDNTKEYWRVVKIE